MAEHEQMIDYSAHQELIYFISQSIIIIPTEKHSLLYHVPCKSSLYLTSQKSISTRKCVIPVVCVKLGKGM